MSSPKRRKHRPQRMCVVCRTTDDKRALTRLVRTPQGVLVDSTGKQTGRGAYLCASPTCWHTAATSHTLGAALRTRLSDADRERIRQAAPANNDHIDRDLAL